jgi:hypothetical protein
VLVGMAGAGGAGGAVTGVSAMGASVPMQPPATSTSPQPTAELQQDGTIKTSAPPGGTLPPIPLSAPGFPTLPPTATPSFESVQPVTVPPGTSLYSVVDDPSSAGGSYWTPDVPASGGSGDWNSGCVLVAAQAPAEGLKAWMGAASSQSGMPGGGTQLWVPPGSLAPGAIAQAPWSGPAQQAQQAANQAAQAAQLASNQATQAQQAANQMQQSAKQTEQQVQQATQGLPKGL